MLVDIRLVNIYIYKKITGQIKKKKKLKGSQKCFRRKKEKKTESLDNTY